MAYLRKVHNKCDATLVPSETVKKELEEAKFENIKIMGRGVDTELFNPSKRSALLRTQWGARNATPVVLIVGRLAAEKNLQFALESLDSLKGQVPDLQTVVVGDGPIRAQLETNFPHVHFVGALTGEELAQHYASADLLYFASETETFGNVLLEAMASGLITVSYDYAASHKYVENKINGFHAPLGNEDALTEMLLMGIRSAQDQFIKVKAEATVQSLSWEKIAQDFVGYFREVIEAKPINKRRVKEKKTLNVRALFLSDIHLGTEDSKAREVCDVLKHVKCEKLYLNGDIIDGWALKRGGKWKKSHTKAVRALLKKSEEKNCEVIYTRGNHDDFLTPFAPAYIGGFQIKKEYVHVSAKGDKYLVIHGDGFDSVCTNHKWLASLGAVGYDFLLRINRLYNKYRSWRGKEYFSISKAIKAKVKSAVSFVDKYEDKLNELATSRGYQGIICGHIHTPADKDIDGIHYLNSGDWVETMSCVVEHHDGSFELLYYNDLLERFSSKTKHAKPQQAKEPNGKTEIQTPAPKAIEPAEQAEQAERASSSIPYRRDTITLSSRASAIDTLMKK
eukprot:Seg14748.2 transcript_id=Seg14748.2/GoldUCD/mRNA.D3Y31 product="GDP-mannose-dependent alpha-mannosyltransferase" protein_id=Seg14748.2/GoldUCD/D3Y31